MKEHLQKNLKIHGKKMRKILVIIGRGKDATKGIGATVGGTQVVGATSGTLGIPGIPRGFCKKLGCIIGKAGGGGGGIIGVGK